MAIKPWYKVITPREDLREGKPLDAAEFAVHLDHVRDGHALDDYQNPRRFFERTFLTKNLILLSSEVLRRLSGEITETSAVFNMSTQFGGGKTHTLTLLYHLAKGGSSANKLPGVSVLLNAAGIKSVPSAAVAVFVGTEFDSLQGRGGNDGTPQRRTPWGEIAYQLQGDYGFEIIKEHDQKAIAPAGDVIRKIIPSDKPCLILMDEVMNYISRSRKSGLNTQFYDFIQNLSETVRGQKNIAFAVSIPASELEMSAEDNADFSRLKKLLDRVGKPVVISSEDETAEIIRRRLFEWDTQAIGHDGKVLLHKDAKDVCNLYADWVIQHRQQIPEWFPVDNARKVFSSTYPFHPMVFSVFERKWQSLHRFQQTRGILRLLAQWVSDAYKTGFKRIQSDGLIGLGTAPLGDSLFRRAVLEQLGEDRLESVITADIAGRNESFAVRLDKEAIANIKKSRLHQKVAVSIFFESSGGQIQKEATLPEIRLATAEPDLDIGNIETVLESLSTNCYYMMVEKNRYRFSLTPNLNKLLSDRRANIQNQSIEERIKSEIQKVFTSDFGVERIFFPAKSNQIPDRPVLTIVVLPPDKTIADNDTLRFIESATKEYGTSGRTYKTALIWVIADSEATLNEEARKLLAWEDIQNNEYNRLDETQQRQLSENIKKARRDLGEAVWRSYKNIALLGKDNIIRTIDLGLVHSSAADNLVQFIIQRLKEDDEITDSVNPNFLVRNWPPAYKEWSTKSVRDAFFASPLFPRLLRSDRIKESIALGVSNGLFAYVGKKSSEHYEPFFFEKEINLMEIEISDDVFIITAEEARKHIEPPKLKYLEIDPQNAQIKVNNVLTFRARGLDQHGRDYPIDKVEWHTTGGSIDVNGVFKACDKVGEYVVSVKSGKVKSESVVNIIAKETTVPEAQDKHNQKKLKWTGELPHQKWMNFYTKVLAKYANTGGLKIKIELEVTSPEGVSQQNIEETKQALRDLGLEDDLYDSQN